MCHYVSDRIETVIEGISPVLLFVASSDADILQGMVLFDDKRVIG